VIGSISHCQPKPLADRDVYHCRLVAWAGSDTDLHCRVIRTSIFFFFKFSANDPVAKGYHCRLVRNR
jgi:hypothetical protein